LAHEAAVCKKQSEELWEILDAASRLAEGYNKAENRNRWSRYISEAFAREKPITIATVFALAKKHGWRAWSPSESEASEAAAADANASQSPKLNISFSNIPHRQWLYGVDLIRVTLPFWRHQAEPGRLPSLSAWPYALRRVRKF
jgi:hypothetical protein